MWCVVVVVVKMFFLFFFTLFRFLSSFTLSLSSHMSLSLLLYAQLTPALNTSVHGPRPIRAFGEMFVSCKKNL